MCATFAKKLKHFHCGLISFSLLATDPKRQIGAVTILNVFKSDEIVRFYKFSLGQGCSRICYLGSAPWGVESDSKFGTLYYLYLEIHIYKFSALWL